MAVATLAIVLVSACTSDGVRPRSTGSTPDESGSRTPPASPVAPLTGTALDADRATLERPVLAVKFDNHVDARPLSGIVEADIVYETRVDGDHTRLLALFHSDVPDVAGPLRSTRVTDAALLAPYNAVYAAEAAAGGIQRTLANYGVLPVLPEDEPDAFRYPGGTERTYVVPREILRAAAGEVPPARVTVWPRSPRPPTGDECADDDPPGCRPTTAGDIQLRFAPGYDVTWSFDAASGRYTRKEASGDSVDAGGRTVTAHNVIVARIPDRFETCCENAGAPPEETGVVGEFPIVVHRDGLAIEGRWVKHDPGRHERFESLGGDPIRLKPGVTWVELLPRDGAGDG